MSNTKKISFGVLGLLIIGIVWYYYHWRQEEFIPSTENVVTMYAENLGTIPPNTAVMIVTDGKRRYEVRMESDLKKSGSVIFTPGK